MKPDDAIARIWPGREVTYEPLGGGITNHNFKVTVGGEVFVLRIGGRATELLGIDRRAEAAATRMAAATGVGPEVVSFLEPEGFLVTRFIEGEPIPPERMGEPDMIVRVAAALRSIHEGPEIPGRFDPHRVVEAYREIAEAHGVNPPQDYRWAKDIADRIAAARGPQPLVPCHDDLLNGNFLFDGERIRIVDWEYAGMGDRAFDLANLSVNHGFDLEQDEALLAAYLDRRPKRSDVASLRLMRFMSDLREGMWGVVQQGVSELDFDFRRYAGLHFERLHAAAADPAFDGWLMEAA